MTELLESAFQKAVRELSETEQDTLAKFLLQYNLHNFLSEGIRFISDYNPDTQQAIRDATERNNVNRYNSADELFTKLGV